MLGRRTELDSSELGEFSERQSLTNGMLDLLQTRDRQTQEGFATAELLLQCISLMKSVRRGVGSERGGRPERKRGGGEEKRERERERCFLRFHVLPQPPQFADKGCCCQGDLTEKGKVSGCVACSCAGSLEAKGIDKMISVPPPHNKSCTHDILP